MGIPDFFHDVKSMFFKVICTDFRQSLLAENQYELTADIFNHSLFFLIRCIIRQQKFQRRSQLTAAGKGFHCAEHPFVVGGKFSVQKKNKRNGILNKFRQRKCGGTGFVVQMAALKIILSALGNDCQACGNFFQADIFGHAG